MKGAFYIFFMLCSYPLWAATDFDKALHLANQKNYDEAAELFLKVTQTEPGNASAFYNAGNCFQKSEQHGRAIWAYEKVMKIDPSDDDALANAAVSREKLGFNNELPATHSAIDALLCNTGTNVWSWMLIFSCIFAGGFLFLYIADPNSPWRRVHGLLLVGLIVLTPLLYMAARRSYNYQRSVHYGVVTKQSIPSFVNTLGERTALDIGEGTLLDVKGPEQKGFLFVQLEDGKEVYVKSSDLDLI